MGRRASSAGVRSVVVGVRLSAAEARDLDGRRGNLSRSEWLRWLLLRERKSDTKRQT